jgi:CBS domain-containing protein
MAIADVMNLRLVSVRPEDEVRLAIARMNEENVGSVAVCRGTELVGIFTERDVLRLAGEGPGFLDVKIGDVMTTQVVTVAPDDDVVAAARLMSERRIRHLPVVEGGNVLGIAGIRDVMRTLVERLWRDHDPEVRETAKQLMSRRP